MQVPAKYIESILKEILIGLCVKVGPGLRDLGTLGLETQDPLQCVSDPTIIYVCICKKDAHQFRNITFRLIIKSIISFKQTALRLKVH